MGARLRSLALIPLLIPGPFSWAGESSPEALVVMVYVSTLRCEGQHPKLKQTIASAYAAWAKRNKKYVDSAKQRVDFAGIASQYKSQKAKDKPVPYETCVAYARRLRDPANDIKK